MIELAPGVHALGHGAGGRVRAFLIADGGELTLVDPLIERDARLVLEAIHALGRTPSDLKRIGITHTHRSHLSGLAELKHRSGATAYAHPWEADIVGGQRRAQPVTLLPKQSLRLLPFQIGLRLNLRSTPPCPVDEPLEEGDALARVPGCVQHLQRPDRLYGRKPDPPTWNRVNAPHTLPHVPL